jgi:glycosyltransferase involved in cell wall biosynthesis
MRVYLDVSSAVHAKAGLARYAHSLAEELRPLLGEHLVLFQNSLGKRGPLAGWEQHPTRGVRLGYKPWRTAVWLSQVLRQPLDGLLPSASLFHATEHLLPYLAHVPTVLTVHDLIFERFPQHHKWMNYQYLRAAMPLFCRRASALIAISAATRDDLVRFYHIDPAKITVIPEAAAPHFVPQTAARVAEVRTRYALPPRYVLAVGTIEPRKNLTRLAEACGPLLAEGLMDGLVLVGSKGWLYEGFFERLEQLPWRERVLLPGFVEEQDLPALYSGAMLTAQPSLWEGFGLPVLEAMACGSPVCASGISSLPEVGGDAACYFDPEDSDSILSTLRMVLRDAALRQELRARGLARASLFSWRRTAEHTLALYERVIAAQHTSS